jgi:hypothetical protein
MKPTNEQSKVHRRQLLGAAGTVGALAAGATLVAKAPEELINTAAGKPAREKGGGYQVTAHVLRYYQTTKV